MLDEARKGLSEDDVSEFEDLEEPSEDPEAAFSAPEPVDSEAYSAEI